MLTPLALIDIAFVCLLEAANNHEASIRAQLQSHLGLRGISSVAPDQDMPPETKASRKASRVLSSLDPSTLKAEECVDISGTQRPTLRFKLTPTKVHYRLVREGGRARCVPFPPGTRGFFYFHRSLRGHAAAGEIRFRVLRGENAPLPISEAFALGSDLISQNRITPWRVHVLNVFRSYPAIRAQLLAEGLVSEVQAGQIDAILASGVNPGRLRIILENIADPFIWDLRNYRPVLLILDQEGAFSAWLNIYPVIPLDLAPNWTGTRSGKALVRFELAEVEPGGPPKVVIRVLKIIEPLKPENAEIANEDGAMVNHKVG
ncbi:hypothetical protein FA13DRAFT_1817168 [Coprinellus micaceus]|uniref:Uncharacterized protein n=1 Tax=Coprinellus micaceus TaxID=71717 RepID=A0A4Y7SVN9_COPMI|nr:hypothetical protein FA13DRAFT_1817168 [Coprinellus micaceus]